MPLDFFPTELESQVDKTFYNSELGGEGWTLFQLSIAIDASPGMTWVIRNAIEAKEHELINQGFYLLEIDTLETTRRQVLGLPVWATHEAKIYFTKPQGIGVIDPFTWIAIGLISAIVFAGSTLIVWRITQSQMVSQIEATNRVDKTAQVAKDAVSAKMNIWSDKTLSDGEKQRRVDEIDQIVNKAFSTIKDVSESATKTPFELPSAGDISGIIKWLAIGAGIYLLITAMPAIKQAIPKRANPIRRRYLLR